MERLVSLKGLILLQIKFMRLMAFIRVILIKPSSSLYRLLLALETAVQLLCALSARILTEPFDPDKSIELFGSYKLEDAPEQQTEEVISK